MKKWSYALISSAIILALWTVTSVVFARAFTGKNTLSTVSLQHTVAEAGSESGAAGDDASALEKIKCKRLPVLMYHSILKSRKGTYIVSPAQLEADLTALENQGYTTVFPSEVAAYNRGEYELPEKPILLTFDDGLYNNMYYGLPILKAHNAKALISVVGKFSDDSIKRGEVGNPNYAYLSWEQMTELADSGCFEIGNHSYNMHAYSPRFGMDKLWGEDEAAYRSAIRADVTKTQDKIDACLAKSRFYNNKNDILNGDAADTKLIPHVKALAFPFGKYTSAAIDELTALGFDVLFSCNEGVNYVHFGGGKLQMLRRVNRNGAYSVSEVLRRVNAE